MTGTNHIVCLKAENFKRLLAVEISPDGKVVQVTGRNAQGKSSVLDAIEATLAGLKSCPPRPIRRGADEARIVVETEELIVTRRFTDAGSTLVVTGKDGAPMRRPQDVLDKLICNLGFDPLAFTRMDPKKQSETLRKLVGLDFSDIEARRQQAYDARTQVNRDLERAKAQLTAMPTGQGAPEKETPIGDVAQKLNEAAKAQRQKTSLEADAKAALDEIERIDEQIFELNTRRAKQEEIAEKAAADARAIEVPDTSDMQKQLDQAETNNRKVRERKAFEEKERHVTQLRQDSDDLSAAVKKAIEEKESTLAAAEFPVPGLSVNEDGVTFNGVPLEQASSAEKLKIGVSMAVAMNPKLRVCIIRDGSLLDDESMEQLRKAAEAYDLQVWVERVDSSGEIGVVIEDGQVAGASTAAA